MNRSNPHPTSAEAFARRFRLLMSYHDLTLRDIAAATHSAVSTVGTWRNGRVPSSRKVLEQLAEIFHVSVAYLLTGEPAAQDSSPSNEAASRFLLELELLSQALNNEAPPPKPGSDKLLQEDGPAIPYGGKAFSTNKSVGQRRQIERYLKTYLDRAAGVPGGLAHTWVQLRREFPLDLYERLRH